MKRIIPAGLGLTLVLAIAAPLLAHGAAVLKSDRASIAAGGTLRLHGSEFDAGATFRLRLVGVLDTLALGSVKADTAESFVTDVVIPGTARPGSYRIEAVAPDSGVGARMDLEVTAAGEAMVNPAGHGEPGTNAPTARAGEIVVQRSFSGAGWGIIGLLVGFGGRLGLGLFAGAAGAGRRSAATTDDR
ncbi:MAG TPA: hypothetical protein VJ957_05630 [Longimicrobiales bacterium]|nr:hypothetical protein [Longimicrobiales bacterium]